MTSLKEPDQALGAGSDVPDVTVWTDPGQPLNLRETALDGPYVLFFYLVDWSST
ncbi:MAG: hypothetical protein ACR2OD_02420 [Gaiellaceae bacterium]